MAQQWCILVVEGDEALNRSIVATLAQDGYSVQGVASGGEAIKILWTSEQHLVIGDRALPDVDGFDLLQWIRAYRPKTRMMMLATPGASGRRTRALEQGAVAYFEKPIDLLLLKVEVRRLLQQTGFSANLDSFDLLDVIQIINMSRKSISLVVHTGLEEQGMLGFQEGELVWAEYGALRGEEAFFALAAYKNGMVTQQAWSGAASPNVTQPLSRLIMQALQYRSKYEAAQQISGEHQALRDQFSMQASLEVEEPLDTLLTEAPDDRPFIYVAEEAVQNTTQAQTEAKPWWQESAKVSRVTRPEQPLSASATDGSSSPAQDTPRSGVRKMMEGSNGAHEAGRNANITPSTVRKTPVGQRSDLPSWLMDQPTQFEVQALQPIQTIQTIQPSQPSQSSQQVSSEPAMQSASHNSQVMPVTKASESLSMSAVTRTTEDLYGGQPQSGQIVGTEIMEEPKTPQPSSRRNYAALVSALETVGYSLSGFIAIAVVTMDGQPIAQVATDDQDITDMCRAWSEVLRLALQTLDKGVWGQHEDTIITSATHHILLRVPGYASDVFQVLVTTRESDPVESLDMLATVEGAIISAL